MNYPGVQRFSGVRDLGGDEAEKEGIFSGKISNELVQITDDNRQIRLF
jgi:hypothetical protein